MWLSPHSMRCGIWAPPSLTEGVDSTHKLFKNEVRPLVKGNMKDCGSGQAICMVLHQDVIDYLGLVVGQLSKAESMNIL